MGDHEHIKDLESFRAEGASSKGRLYGLDFARGLACLSMPIYHCVYNLRVVGLTDSQWTNHWFWETYQSFGLGTFVMVSGMSFVMSTKRTLRWKRLLKRAVKLGLVAIGISLVTYLVMPERFVRFGVIHFFFATILLALVFRPMKHWAIVPGLLIVLLSLAVSAEGVNPSPWLYVTGLMSDRPPSMDYIPLVPWFGVFLMGMGIANWLRVPEQRNSPSHWIRPVIWLGKHSLAFYLLHLPVVYGLLMLIAYLLR